MAESIDENIIISVNCHAKADSLCEELMIEICPVADKELLAGFFSLESDEWHPLETVSKATTKTLPDYISKLLDCAPDQIFMRHIPWIGKQRDAEQPAYMVIIANAASMGFNTFLIGTPENAADANAG